ncbi:MAG: hypothetical protein ACREQ9_11160, partial [Candidatus Binatia bacterium]
MRRLRRRLSGLALILLLLVAAVAAEATTYFDEQRGEIQARLATQNTFQHNGTNAINWVQFRNEIRFDLKYQLIPPGEEIGILKNANFNLLYRGRYDPVFDIRDDY